MKNEWIKNTGTVPEGVGPDTVIEVEYRDGAVHVWRNDCAHIPYNHDALWTFSGFSLDIIRWRIAQ